MSKYQYSEVALAPTYINPKHATALPYIKTSDNSLVCAATEKEPQQLESLQPD